jgi:hypothetical protein
VYIGLSQYLPSFLCTFPMGVKGLGFVFATAAVPLFAAEKKSLIAALCEIPLSTKSVRQQCQEKHAASSGAGAFSL